MTTTQTATDIPLQQNCYYQIKQLKSSIDHHYRRKLVALGLVPGARFLVKRIAPLGGPIQLNINGSSLSLRYHELTTLFSLEMVSS